MRKRTIFVVEDDAKIAELLADYLRNAGYQVIIFGDARSVLDRARANEPQAVILDVMLPAGDGMTLCAGFREFSSVPILMLTARVDENDLLQALEIGADDYVTKPFSPKQVVARINALTRRAAGRLSNQPNVAGFQVHEEEMRITWLGQCLDLSPFEFRILATIVRFPGRVFSRDQLLSVLGDQSRNTGDRAVDSHIKNIRRKLAEIDPNSRCIASVYGVGYKLTVN